MKSIKTYILLLLSLSVISCNVTTEYQKANANDPRIQAPNEPIFIAKPAKLNFRVVNAHANISGRNYVMDLHKRPTILQVNDNIYRLELTLKRDSQSSLRGDEVIVTHFSYDDLELIFFGDKNRNQIYDRYESSKRYLIQHTFELVHKDNKIYGQARSLNISLGREHVSSFHNLKNLEFQLLFISN